MTCVTQIKWGYIKGDKTKHISPKLFYTNDLEENGDTIVQICSENNRIDLFTKLLPIATFEKLVHNIRM